MAKITRNQDELDELKRIFSLRPIDNFSKKDLNFLKKHEKKINELTKNKGKAFKDGGLIGNQDKIDLNNNNKIDKGDFEMLNKKKGMAMGGKVKAKGMAMGGKVKSKGYAMGGKVKAKGMAMGGKVKAKGMAMGGKVKSKGYAMGGKVNSKGQAMGGAGFGAARSSGKPIITY